MAEGEAKSGRGRSNARNARRTARLNAVQALYQIDMVKADVEPVIDEFITHRLPAEGDRPLFVRIVGGVKDRAKEIDHMIGQSLSEGWQLDRLETVLRAVLRAGVYELLAETAVPPRVVINEYVEIAHAFFSGREPAMVNGVLDKLARVLRADELSSGQNEH